MNTNLEKIQNALMSLLQNQSIDAYTVFLDKASGRYIQFAGTQNQKLTLDLPVQSLSEHEFETAQAVFREYGSDLEVMPLVNRPGGEIVDAHFGFHLQFGQECAAAARVAYYIMLTVFDLKQDFELAIEQNF
ncbi:MAG: hypothetical protein OEZ68_21525 [Gammaproteobacteria bacterium]|nr:hypothetical protein [Gammaproteobacteria bacterium]MDH5803383.1 hypothetical protein [Gammaproteobacteria bacterium]